MDLCAEPKMEGEAASKQDARPHRQLSMRDSQVSRTLGASPSILGSAHRSIQRIRERVIRSAASATFLLHSSIT